MRVNERYNDSPLLREPTVLFNAIKKVLDKKYFSSELSLKYNLANSISLALGFAKKDFFTQLATNKCIKSTIKVGGQEYPIVINENGVLKDVFHSETPFPLDYEEKDIEPQGDGYIRVYLHLPPLFAHLSEIFKVNMKDHLSNTIEAARRVKGFPLSAGYDPTDSSIMFFEIPTENANDLNEKIVGIVSPGNMSPIKYEVNTTLLKAAARVPSNVQEVTKNEQNQIVYNLYYNSTHGQLAMAINERRTTIDQNVLNEQNIAFLNVINNQLKDYTQTNNSNLLIKLDLNTFDLANFKSDFFKKLDASEPFRLNLDKIGKTTYTVVIDGKKALDKIFDRNEPFPLTVLENTIKIEPQHIRFILKVPELLNTLVRLFSVSLSVSILRRIKELDKDKQRHKTISAIPEQQNHDNIQVQIPIDTVGSLPDDRVNGSLPVDGLNNRMIYYTFETGKVQDACLSLLYEKNTMQNATSEENWEDLQKALKAEEAQNANVREPLDDGRDLPVLPTQPKKAKGTKKWKWAKTKPKEPAALKPKKSKNSFWQWGKGKK